MISEFRQIVENKHAKKIQGRLITLSEAESVIKTFDNLTEPNTDTFIGMPIDKMIDFSLVANSKKPSNLINEYISKVEATKVIKEPKKIAKPIIEDIVEEKPTIKEITPIKQEIIAETILPFRDDFYKGLLEQLEQLKSKTIITDNSVITIDSQIEKLTESNLAMVDAFGKIADYIKQNDSNEVIKEMHDNIMANQKFISEHHQTLFENQTALVNNQLFLIESQKSITNAINTLTEKISLITSTPQTSSPHIYVNEGSKSTVKIVERDEKGLITKIIENANADDA